MIVNKHEKSQSMNYLIKGDPMNELIQSLHCSPIKANTPRLNKQEISQLIENLPGWETHERKGELRVEKSFEFRDFRQALAFTNRVAKLAN